MSIVYCKDIAKYKVYIDGKYDKSFSVLKDAKIHEAGHHWLSGLKPEPDAYFGFIYLIEDMLTGMKYVGYKQYHYFRYPCKSSNNMDHDDWNPDCWEPSGWEFYIGSSKILSPVIAKRPSDFKYTILSQHRSKLALMLAEIDEMIERDVLKATLPNGEREYWNQHIGGAEYNLFGRHYKIKHGYSYHPLYHTWKVNREFMCDEWRDDPQGFCDTIESPKEGCSICRKDASLPFSKKNWKYLSLSTAHSRCSKSVKNTSGYTGVVRLASGKYNASITINSRRFHIGIYDTAEEAALFRNEYIDDNNLPHKKAKLDVELSTVTCRSCGKTMRVLDRGGNHYCSYECGKGKVEVPCTYCGATVLKYPAELRKTTLSFCNKECYDKYQKKVADSIERLHDTVEVLCDYCGALILKRPSQAKKYKHHFCSKECHDNYQRKGVKVGFDDVRNLTGDNT